MKGKEIIKRSGGITLIALVITIIVLLILAGVTIATLTGDNGLLSKAATAKNTSTEVKVIEKIKLAYQDYYLGQHTNPGYTFQNAVDKMFGEGVATVTESNDVYKVTFTNGKKYTFNALTKEVAELEEIWTQNETTVTNTKTGQVLEVGDTVYYDSGVAAYEGIGDNQGKWGILGAEDGKLLIMSKQHVGTVELNEKEGCINGSTLLNNACSSFKNSSYADSARSVKVEDINRITGFDDIPSPAENTHSFTLVNGKVSKDGKVPSRWPSTVFEDINGKTLPDDSPILVTGNYYTYKLEEKISERSKSYNLLYAPRYWLNSPYTQVFEGSAMWGFLTVTDFVTSDDGMWYSDGFGNSISNGVRAVVSLKFNIKLSGSSSTGWTISE